MIGRHPVSLYIFEKELDDLMVAAPGCIEKRSASFGTGLLYIDPAFEDDRLKHFEVTSDSKTVERSEASVIGSLHL